MLLSKTQIVFGTLSLRRSRQPRVRLITSPQTHSSWLKVLEAEFAKLETERQRKFDNLKSHLDKDYERFMELRVQSDTGKRKRADTLLRNGSVAVF
jgi:hypothetical protein